MFSKWVINKEELKDYIFAENGDIYRKPFTKDKRSYGWRLIKMQYPNRWKLNGDWWSKRQLATYIEIDPSPVEIFKTDQLPF